MARSFIPVHKCDLAACRALQRASDDIVGPNAAALLEWVQDVNWPVAGPVMERLALLRSDYLLEPLRYILRDSGDAVWKYWVLSCLLPKCGAAVQQALFGEAERLALHPSEGDAEEEVHLVATEFIQSVSLANL
ncbi:hypothetical protein DIPPA_00794 [Diplonema papillatum]|nr:hypothetical protein DIPPA_00794 [Diplonema papillatum]